MTGKVLGALGVTAFENRGISPETAGKYGIYTARRSDSGDVEPYERGNIVVFPFLDRGAVVNEKYRAPSKKFWQRGGGKRTFWNADALDDPALEDGRLALVITEGEIDALSAIECGFPLAVSVPDGAPGVPEGEDPENLAPLDPKAEDTGKFEFLWNNRERLARVKRFVLAVDSDAPGRRLGAELVRRLSAARCSFVTYPEGCKDLNDVLTKRGAEEVAGVINAARPYPVRGLYRLSEFPQHGALQTFSTGWWTLDKHLRLFAGEFMVVTGIPGHGKSSWVLNLLSNAAELHGWRSAIFSPEMPTVPQLRDKLRRIKARRPVDELDRNMIADADEWIERNFVFIDADPTGKDDEEYDLDWVLDRATDAVLRDGVRILVIDPWNEVEHAKRRDESMTEYIGRAIRAMKRFGRLYDVTVIVVAHPTKDIAKEGKSRPPTLYDIESCYSDDTEVLTKRGWLHHGQITAADDIACFDLADGSVVYAQPSAIHRHERCGEMISLRGYGYDLLVTPSHQMVVKPKWTEPVGGDGTYGRPRLWRKSSWQKCQAAKLPSAPFSLPLAGIPIPGAHPVEIAIGNKSYPMKAFCRLIGWYISEGCAGQTGLTWSQTENALAGDFTATFAECGIPASVNWQEPSPTRGYGGTLRSGRWYIGNRFSRELVAWFRENCGEKSHEKRLPESVFDLSPELKRIVLMAYIEGDGCAARAGWRATTVSKRLADDLQRLAVEIGIATSCLVRDVDGFRRQYNLRFGHSGRVETAVRVSRNVERCSYDGLVWCLTVPTGAYFVRRNGRVAVAGNSAHWFNKCDHGIVVDWPDSNIAESVIRVAKVRFEESGERGQVRMKFDRFSGRYDLLLDIQEGTP